MSFQPIYPILNIIQIGLLFIFIGLPPFPSVSVLPTRTHKGKFNGHSVSQVEKLVIMTGVESVNGWVQCNSSAVKKIHCNPPKISFLDQERIISSINWLFRSKYLCKWYFVLIMRLSPFSYILWLQNPSTQVEAVILNGNYSSATRNSLE